MTVELQKENMSMFNRFIAFLFLFTSCINCWICEFFCAMIFWYFCSNNSNLFSIICWNSLFGSSSFSTGVTAGCHGSVWAKRDWVRTGGVGVGSLTVTFFDSFKRDWRAAMSRSTTNKNEQKQSIENSTNFLYSNLEFVHLFSLKRLHFELNFDLPLLILSLNDLVRPLKTLWQFWFRAEQRKENTMKTICLCNEKRLTNSCRFLKLFDFSFQISDFSFIAFDRRLMKEILFVIFFCRFHFRYWTFIIRRFIRLKQRKSQISIRFSRRFYVDNVSSLRNEIV